MSVEHNQRESTPEEQFGRMVRAAREGYAMSQEALSRRLKDDTDTIIDQSGIARLEAGRRAVRLNEVVALAQVLGLEISQSTFTIRPDVMDENMLTRAHQELAEIQMAVQSAHEEVRAKEAGLDSARAHLAELRGMESVLTKRLMVAMEYRRSLDELNDSLGGVDENKPGETVREAVARKRERDRINAIFEANPPAKRRGADNGDR